MIVLLQISCWVRTSKHVENRPMFGEDMDKSLVYWFFDSRKQVRSQPAWTQEQQSNHRNSNKSCVGICNIAHWEKRQISYEYENRISYEQQMIIIKKMKSTVTCKIEHSAFCCAIEFISTASYTSVLCYFQK